jgi:RimJ/RimL family protein N-acetyltransferase
MTPEPPYNRRLPEELETPRLLLRRARVTDAERVYVTYACDPEVARFVLFRPDQTLQDVHEFLEKAEHAWDAGIAATWAITLKPEHKLIGMVDLRFESEANLGYVLARTYWNHGLTTEAVRAVINCAFEMPDIHRVWAICEVSNTASVRVLEKVGMIREGRLERHLVFPNLGEEPRAVYRYGIAREEWKP